MQSNNNRADRMKEVLEKLLSWYWVAARDLPWRKTKDPYCIWISEIMLQQTRVEAVKEYYHRFLSALPTVKHLAEASEEQVLKLWEGLGYYSRARNLKKAAELICKEYGGVFPKDYPIIRKLPGIGDYTAGAISSIAFGQPTPAVDGNVLRVLGRILNDWSDITEQKTKTAMTELLQTVYPKEHCGDVTQSLMELGAAVCIPNGQPKCRECPVGDLCVARQEKTVEFLPVKKEKSKRKTEEKTVFLLECDGKYALRKRVEKGLLHGMWEFPNEKGTLTPKEVTARFPCVVSVESLGKHRHIFTHIEWELTGYRVCVLQEDVAYEWHTKEEIANDYAIPGAFQPFLKDLFS